MNLTYIGETFEMAIPREEFRINDK